MATIEHRFASFQRDNPYHSSLINFVRSVAGQPVSKRRLAFLFRELVEKEDYDKADTRVLLVWISSKTVTQKQGFFGERATKMAPKTRSLVWAD